MSRVILSSESTRVLHFSTALAISKFQATPPSMRTLSLISTEGKTKGTAVDACSPNMKVYRSVVSSNETIFPVRASTLLKCSNLWTVLFPKYSVKKFFIGVVS